MKHPEKHIKKGTQVIVQLIGSVRTRVPATHTGDIVSDGRGRKLISVGFSRLVGKRVPLHAGLVQASRVKLPYWA